MEVVDRLCKQTVSPVRDVLKVRITPSFRNKCLLKRVAFASHIDAKTNLTNGRVRLNQLVRLHKPISRQSQSRSQMCFDLAAVAIVRYTIPHGMLSLKIVLVIWSRS